jgi:hypothetical protein
MLVTDTSIDPLYAEPFLDVDELRTTTDPETDVTVTYRYLHGGFTGTPALFSMYFPLDAESFQGRFFHFTYPTWDEIRSPETIVFAISHGAYGVATNNGGIGGYRVNAAAAKHSRTIAAEMYGTSDSIRGYLYGASGGAFQTLGCMQNTSGVWQGAVPMVPGVPNAAPSFMAAQLLGLRVLGDKLPEIVDAIEPGGSGDPYAGLSDEQRAALREATLLGFPLQGWWQHEWFNGGGLMELLPLLYMLDPTYVDDFWTEPGYAGSEPSVKAARIQHDATVVSVVGAPENQLVLSSVPAGSLLTAELKILSGRASGQSLPILRASGDTVFFGPNANRELLVAIQPGDQVQFDNSSALALEHSPLYQVPGPDEQAWDQFRGEDGAPLHPQRSVLIGPQVAEISSGSIPDGHFEGKMIMLVSTMDIQAFAWSAKWYQAKVLAAKGAEFDDCFRLWFVDHAGHTPLWELDAPDAQAHIVDYDGVCQQALLDLDEWVTSGVQPPASGRYLVTSENQVELPATADERLGIQPVVTLTANGAVRADVAPGETVSFLATAEVPPGAGALVKVEWDLEGAGSFPDVVELDDPSSSVSLEAASAFSSPGTRFAVVRVTSQRQGTAETRYGQIQNLARVRVVVHGDASTPG